MVIYQHLSASNKSTMRTNVQMSLNVAIGQVVTISPAAARVRINKMNKCTNFADCFDGHGCAPIPHHAYSPMEENFSSLEASEHCHQASICSNNINWTFLRHFFLLFFNIDSLKKVVK